MTLTNLNTCKKCAYWHKMSMRSVTGTCSNPKVIQQQIEKSKKGMTVLPVIYFTKDFGCIFWEKASAKT